MAGRVFLWAGIALLVAAAFGSILLVRPTESLMSPGLFPVADAGQPRLAAQLPAGQEAIVVKLDAMRGLAGTVRAGDRVDLYGFFPTPSEDEAASTQMLLRDVRVQEVVTTADAPMIVLTMSAQRALLVQGAMQVGVRPFVTLCSAESGCTSSATRTSFSDADLVDRVTAGSPGQPQ